MNSLIPDYFAVNTLSKRGEVGRRFIDNLPQIIEKAVGKWNLTLLPPFANLTYNYVTPALTANHEKVVLKIGVPEHGAFQKETEALRIYQGQGAVRLLQVDLTNNAALLEYIDPGKPLSSLEDDTEATIIIANTLRQLWKPVKDSTSFSNMQKWISAFSGLKNKFNGSSGPIPENIFQKAQEIFTQYTSESYDEVLIHNDLHHDNILSSHRDGWLAIDPKGIIGDRAYDTAAMLRNPKNLSHNPSIKQILRRRVDILSHELDIEKLRILNWGFTHAVLSAIWSIDEGEERPEAIDFAEFLYTIRI